MRILDFDTFEEINIPEEIDGYFVSGTYASPEAYDSIDNITKFALNADDYENVIYYHKYSEQEKEEQKKVKDQEDEQSSIDIAICELYENLI